MEEQYIEALKKSALGYSYVEKQEIYEETTTSKKKRIIQTTKQVPPNPQAIQMILNMEKQAEADIIKALEKK